jgi:hypothetical protein
MIARSIEGGTSWSPKIRFINKAVKATTQTAESIIKANIDKSINKIMNQ